LGSFILAVTDESTARGWRHTRTLTAWVDVDTVVGDVVLRTKRAEVDCVTAKPYMHVGILVHDLEEALGRMSEVLDVTFTPPLRAKMDGLQVGTETQAPELYLAYSQQGPPYYELIETQKDGLWGRQHGEGLHHVGLWEPECHHQLRRMSSLGIEAEAVQYLPDGQIGVAYFRPDGFYGTRIEIVNQIMQDAMEEWFRTGNPPV